MECVGVDGGMGVLMEEWGDAEGMVYLLLMGEWRALMEGWC